MGDDCVFRVCDVVSEVLLIFLNRDVIVTNSIITNLRINIMVVHYTPISLYSH